MSDERKTVYKEYRLAKSHLKSGRDFADWMKIARGYDQARREAMHRSGTNAPHGAAYAAAFAEIDRREKLIDRDPSGKEFPTREDRTYCIYLLENYDAPSHDPRRPSIKTWRDKLSDGERAKLNHPKRVWSGYLAATEPREEREAKRAAREQKAPKSNPHVEALADAEVREHAAQRETESLRELMARVRKVMADQLPDDLRDAIDKALA
jgi:hypothetical protein